MTPHPVAETVPQFLSLVAIRVSLLLLAIVMAAEAGGIRRSNRWLVWLWLIGALGAISHSFGSLATFHNGSQRDAFESTALQTKELLGFAFGAGLFVNYLFLAVWIFDAIFAAVAPLKHRLLPKLYHRIVIGFLAFIAFNGTVVFKSGWLRWTGVACSIAILSVLIYQRCRRGESCRVEH